MLKSWIAAAKRAPPPETGKPASHSFEAFPL